MLIERWLLGDKEIVVPHVWGTERDLRWEGPEIYETTFSSDASGWLVFHGVSALARVFVNGELACEHLGIWDAFSVFVDHVGEINLRVEVTKNGGESVPVASIASGFLPYVFGTFGGIYRPVEWLEQKEDPLRPMPAAISRAQFDEHRLVVDGKPVYLRGVLHWGWYPELRHPNPDGDTCKGEIEALQAMGFNCVKFCLWLPPHHYLELLQEKGMLAWIELPIWNPGKHIGQFSRELERIILQYRHHDCVVLWTVGCELGSQILREDRKKLFELVKGLTDGLVKDSSGGAEMYGGDPVEFGDFEDYHPYCDLGEFPIVLDSLVAGPRRRKAILLGECNDFDSHRDLPSIARDAPYWASDDPCLNDQGVRWQYDLPSVLAESRFARDEEASRRLAEQSLEMKLFTHRTFQEWLRSRQFSGSVITGIADTPVSTSGFFDDWGVQKFRAEEVRSFLGPDLLFLIPQRRLPWASGGNCVGRWDAWHVFDGWNRIRVGLHSEAGLEGEITWQIGEQSGIAAARVDPLEPTEILEITWFAEPDTHYDLRVNTEGLSQTWPIESVGKVEGLISECKVESVSAPAFRESAYEFLHPELESIFRGKPHTLYMALNNSFLGEDEFEITGEPLMIRVDTRTYHELPVVGVKDGHTIHSLRVGNDPAGVLVRRMLARIASE